MEVLAYQLKNEKEKGIKLKDEVERLSKKKAKWKKRSKDTVHKYNNAVEHMAQYMITADHRVWLFLQYIFALPGFRFTETGIFPIEIYVKILERGNFGNRDYCSLRLSCKMFASLLGFNADENRWAIRINAQ